MRLAAWLVVTLEKEVISGTKTLAGVPGDDCTTLMRLFACSEVSAAAEETAGNMEAMTNPTARFLIFVWLCVKWYAYAGGLQDSKGGQASLCVYKADIEHVEEA